MQLASTKAPLDTLMKPWLAASAPRKQTCRAAPWSTHILTRMRRILRRAVEATPTWCDAYFHPSALRRLPFCQSRHCEPWTEKSL